MFILDLAAFGKSDPKALFPFVESWKQYYDDKKYRTQEYLTNLRLGTELTEADIKALLRWKDPRMLTHPKTSDNLPNKRVTKVLARIRDLNRFRSGDISADEFANITASIYPGGFIWQMFLFHIARPAECPIADQHVFRAFRKLQRLPEPESVESFRSYSEWFNLLAAEYRHSKRINQNDLAAVVTANKDLDSALFAFGQFLSRYDRA